MNAGLIFISQFSMIFLLGLQTINVKDGREFSAAFVSLLLSLMSWNITGTVSSHYHEGMLSLIFASFAISGPLGIVASIRLNKWMSKKRKK
jgi:hypothetical protein